MKETQLICRKTKRNSVREKARKERIFANKTIEINGLNRDDILGINSRLICEEVILKIVCKNQYNVSKMLVMKRCQTKQRRNSNLSDHNL